MSENKTFNIDNILTPDEIQRALALYNIVPRGTFARRVKEELILPNLKRIEQNIGQDMDPMFLAYAVEYIIGEAAKIQDQSHDATHENVGVENDDDPGADGFPSGRIHLGRRPPVV